MSTSQIRKKFLEYFKNQGHTLVPSSPVVPFDDPTLLFVNAGMNQFKDVFLGKNQREYSRAASAQKCIRVGGKHNDLENVGHTSRHLTFFEMLGNFSFGDYFKEEAIRFAWEVSTEVFGLDPERIWPTVFRDDDEAFELWKMYVKEERITRFEEKHNFWAMGETGPCGPCSELLYDRGDRYGPAKNPKEDVKEERYLEFWNLVFMQYNRGLSGEMNSLPSPSIDTGAGIERIIGLQMGVDNVFETDVLRRLIAEVEILSGKKYEKEGVHTAAFHVIADHMRALSFSIADGVMPGNVDRGYVLRKVLRRAVRYGRTLGFDRPFLAGVLPSLIEMMGDDYKELKESKERIAEILTVEEEAFLRTLQRGGNLLGQVIEKAKDSGSKISGDAAFKLKDTYGFPLEEILLLAKDADLTVDEKRYRKLEDEARERSRKAHQKVSQTVDEALFSGCSSEFTGFTEKKSEGKVQEIRVEGSEGMLVLDRTPFYAEMGGQVGDTGLIRGERGLFEVTDTQAPSPGVIVHFGKLEGEFHAGDAVLAEVDCVRRERIECNHTATHLLHWALQKVLGPHTKQAGSLVEASRLRFDFNHHKALTKSEIREVEALINAKIRENLPVKWYEMDYKDVQEQGEIKQFFGEKYGSKVRVVDIDFSKELCGGTHTERLGNIGLFKIESESSIAAGVRRIVAITGSESEEMVLETQGLIEEMAKLLKAKTGNVLESLKSALDEQSALAKKVKALEKAQARQLAEGVLTVGVVPMIVKEVEISPKSLRPFADEVMKHLKSGVVALGIREPKKCQLLVMVSDDWIAKGLSAKALIDVAAPLIQGGGGGKSSSAQAGGKEPKKLSEALMKVKEIVEVCES